MEVNEVLKCLSRNRVFLDWRKSNKNDYFSYAFKMLNEGHDDDWQIGFYSKKRDTITTFVIEDNRVSIRQDEEIFKKDGMGVIEVELRDVKTPLDKIMKNANEYKSKKYPAEHGIKIIVVLQNIGKLGVVWNITFITEKFNTLNIKLSAVNGRILEDKLTSLISFGK